MLGIQFTTELSTGVLNTVPGAGWYAMLHKRNTHVPNGRIYAATAAVNVGYHSAVGRAEHLTLVEALGLWASQSSAFSDH